MKSWLLICSLLLATIAPAQKKNITLEKLVGIGLLPDAGLPEALAKKGFKLVAHDSVLYFEKKAKAGNTEQFIHIIRTPQNSTLRFGTQNSEEFVQIAKDLERQQFSFPTGNTAMPGVYELYQKGPWMMVPQIIQKEDGNWYQFSLELTKLPQFSDMRFAEDLMQLQSHEQFAAVFGPSQVRRDVFYFSEKDLSKCSILYPNSIRQVIVVWKDQVNNRGISMLILGGSMQGSTNPTYFNENGTNQWQSQMGVFVGMPLRQLQEANGGPLQFFGWETEEPGVIAMHNEGGINFKKLGVQLQCIDCNEDRFYSDKPLLNSAVLLRESRRVYVKTIVLKP